MTDEKANEHSSPAASPTGKRAGTDKPTGSSGSASRVAVRAAERSRRRITADSTPDLGTRIERRRDAFWNQYAAGGGAADARQRTADTAADAASGQQSQRGGDKERGAEGRDASARRPGP